MVNMSAKLYSTDVILLQIRDSDNRLILRSIYFVTFESHLN